MATRLTIILDSGGFLFDDRDGTTHVDVGYFETAGASDIEVFEDGIQIQPPPNEKLGKGNNRIEVEHLEADGTANIGVNLSTSFTSDILKEEDLYDPKDVPDLITAAYDCILRFHSGHFESADVRPRRFKELWLSDDAPTGKELVTRPIANDVMVHYDLADGEILRLRGSDGTDAWSSASVGHGTKHVEVKVLADTFADPDYYKRALGHRAAHYFLPNPDPPPLAGASLAGISLSPARRYMCPLAPSGHYEKDLARYRRTNPPRCPIHNTLLVLKP